ncbi:UvrD-helicase domain-containing protein [Nocardia rhizosphaerae]|uniref:DNA 3'-5' helicase n=1 Tax=Nocardia rhizosphaerae TaxID=1691571 RepID=A0ABV8L4Q7_9NOCA
MTGNNARPTVRLPRMLADDIRDLDDDQQAAVTTVGNLVVIAGPGSGKTRTLVARAGYLLCSDISPLRGLAAITYTNQAALELHQRLARLGISEPHRLFAGTLHTFCLSQVLPYAELMDVSLPGRDALMSSRDINELRDECAEVAGANRWALREVFAPLRRRMAAGEDVSDENPANVAAIQRYEYECDRLSIWDFDAVVFKSVALMREFPVVAAVVKAKYPTILIDEYQDLGAALHSLVELLVDSGVSVTAVGDADQSIFGFTGGDPRYMHALSQREDFAETRLETNYRCGSAVIAAAEVALAESRGWQADPARNDPGVIEIRISSGDSRTQARQAVTAVRGFLAAGVAPNEVAVLLRFRAPLGPLIHEELSVAGIQARLEGTSASLQSAIGKWLASCALYVTRVAEPYQGSAPLELSPAGADVLLGELEHLRSQAGYAHSTMPVLRRMLALHKTLTDVEPGSTRYDVATWTARVAADCDLEPLAIRLGDNRNREELATLLSAEDGQPLDEIANDLESTGRVTIGTYHGAKGRTFTAVLLPALTEGVVPPWGRNYGCPVPPAETKVREERRSFYVALTRSRGSVLLHTTESGVDNRGDQIERGYSRFARELAQQLNLSLP